MGTTTLTAWQELEDREAAAETGRKFCRLRTHPSSLTMVSLVLAETKEPKIFFRFAAQFHFGLLLPTLFNQMSTITGSTWQDPRMSRVLVDLIGSQVSIPIDSIFAKSRLCDTASYHGHYPVLSHSRSTRNNQTENHMCRAEATLLLRFKSRSRQQKHHTPSFCHYRWRC